MRLGKANNNERLCDQDDSFSGGDQSKGEISQKIEMSVGASPRPHPNEWKTSFECSSVASP